MVKVDFFRKIIQLWPEEYQGNITVSANFVCLINPQGISNLITLKSWNEQDVQKMNTTSSSIPITPATEQEKTKITEGGIPDALDYERKVAVMKAKFEMIPEALEILRKMLDDKLIQFELAQKTQGQITGDLKTLEGRFSEKMGFIRNFIEEKQGFVNKLERRVLQVEHIVYSPIKELNCSEANDSVSERKEKGKKNEADI